jgi:hypothetical protein
MKKLFTLLFTLGSLTSVFAQYNNDNRRWEKNDNSYENKNNNGRYPAPSQRPEMNGRNRDNNDYAYNDRRYNNAISMTSRERDFKIQQIRREYDYKISELHQNRFISFREKSRHTQNLEKQKYEQIRNIELCYNDSRNRFNGSRSNRW